MRSPDADALAAELTREQRPRDDQPWPPPREAEDRKDLLLRELGHRGRGSDGSWWNGWRGSSADALNGTSGPGWERGAS